MENKTGSDENPGEESMSFDERKQEAIRRAAEQKKLEETEATEEDFAEWDKIMRQRLIKRLEDHIEQTIQQMHDLRKPEDYKDDAEFETHLKEIRQSYVVELTALRNGQRAIRRYPAFDIFTTIFLTRLMNIKGVN